MFEGQTNSQITMTKVFLSTEDDLIDALLSILRRDRCENLKMHYETSSLSAERTELHLLKASDGQEEEVPVVFAIAASWFNADGEVELMVGVTETEYDWTQDECISICESIIKALEISFRTVDIQEHG